jgi:hypothetical protein
MPLAGGLLARGSGYLALVAEEWAMEAFDALSCSRASTSRRVMRGSPSGIDRRHEECRGGVQSDCNRHGIYVSERQEIV